MALFDVKTYGNDDGPTMLVLGGVHGNEPCGVAAITRLKADIEDGRVRIAHGRLVCIAAVNVAALEADQRFIDRNLNRIIGLDDASDNEGRIATELRPYLREADFLLDLHSYQVGGAAFVFASDDGLTMEFARSTGPAAIITGWNDCYRRTFPDAPSSGIGTTEYAREHGAIALTFECGQHRDPNAPLAGYDAILNALWHAGLLAGERAGTAPLPDAPHWRLNHIFMKQQEGQLVRDWQHLQHVRQGEIFATYTDGGQIVFPEDGAVILPNRHATLNSEWGYLGRLAA